MHPALPIPDWHADARQIALEFHVFSSRAIDPPLTPRQARQGMTMIAALARHCGFDGPPLGYDYEPWPRLAALDEREPIPRFRQHEFWQSCQSSEIQRARQARQVARRRWRNQERDIAIWQARRAGQSYRAISRLARLSLSAVWAVVQRIEAGRARVIRAHMATLRQTGSRLIPRELAAVMGRELFVLARRSICLLRDRSIDNNPTVTPICASHANSAVAAMAAGLAKEAGRTSTDPLDRRPESGESKRERAAEEYRAWTAIQQDDDRVRPAPPSWNAERWHALPPDTRDNILHFSRGTRAQSRAAGVLERIRADIAADRARIQAL